MPDPTLADVRRLQEQRLVLGRAARRLARAAGFEDTLKQTLAACLPALGDCGFFDVVIGPGEVRRTVAAHEAPHIEQALAPTRWEKQSHPQLNLCALSSGEPALHPDIDEAWYQRAARSPQQLEAFRSLGFRSLLSVPLSYQDELVGALTLFMGASGRRHGPEDLELATELALLAAPAVANARLVLQHERTEWALRRSSDRLRIAVEAGQVGTGTGTSRADASNGRTASTRCTGCPWAATPAGSRAFARASIPRTANAPSRRCRRRWRAAAATRWSSAPCGPTAACGGSPPAASWSATAKAAPSA